MYKNGHVMRAFSSRDQSHVSTRETGQSFFRRNSPRTLRRYGETGSRCGCVVRQLNTKTRVTKIIIHGGTLADVTSVKYVRKTHVDN